MSNIFYRKKLVKPMNQAPNLGRLHSRSKFESQHKNLEVIHCGKNGVSCPYFLKASLYQFKWVFKTFFRENSFNCESSNLIYVVIYQECKEEYIGETSGPVKERIIIYRQYISRPQYQQLAVEERLRTCRDEKFHRFPFFRILQENKSLRKSYDNYFIEKIELLLNKKTYVGKPPKVVVLNMMLTSYLIPRQRQISKKKIITFLHTWKTTSVKPVVCNS